MSKSSQEFQKQRNREKYLVKTYGITTQIYEELLGRQRGACAVCKRPSKQFRTRLAVDHNHRTGAIRGLLCTHCNRYVVGRHADPVLLHNAGDYLNQETGYFVPKKKPRPKTRKGG